MKELSIEEKALAYDEIVARAKKYLEDCPDRVDARGCIEHLIPELAESEDEKIRRGLINGFNFISDEEYWGTEKFSLRIKDILAWLEKQGELVAEYEDKLDMCACRYFDKGYKGGLEKQREQKDVVYPKYRIKDWIQCDNYEPIQIINIKNNTYEWSNGDIRPIEIVDNNNHIHLVEPKPEWSEEDVIWLNKAIKYVENYYLASEELAKYTDSEHLNKRCIDNTVNFLKFLRSQILSNMERIGSRMEETL